MRKQKIFSKETLTQTYGRGEKSFIAMGKELNICPKELKRQMILANIITFDLEPYKHLTKSVLETDYQILDAKKIAKKYKISESTLNILFDLYKIERKKASYTINENFFALENSETFYVAGLMAADGDLYKSKGCVNINRLSLSLKASDKNHLEKIKNLLEYSGPLYYKDYTEYPSYCLEIGSVKLCEGIKKFGLTQRKSLTYKMPEWLIEHPLVNYFLLGYFDGDGGFYIRKNGYDCQLGIRGTVEHLQQIHQILFKDKIVEKKEKITKISSGIGRLVYGGVPCVRKIYEYLHQDSTIHLDRKYQQYLQIKKINNDKNQKDLSRIERNAKIIIDYRDGIEARELGGKYDMHPTSISNLIHDLTKKQKFDYCYYDPFIIDKIKLNKSNILKLSIKDREQLVYSIFLYLRSRDIVFKLPTNEFENEYKKLKNIELNISDVIEYNSKNNIDLMSRLYCDNFYHTKVCDRKSFWEAYNNDDNLLLFIRNRLGLDPKNGYNPGIVSVSSIINGFKSLGLCLIPSIFKAYTAKQIYMKFASPGETVLDFSAGWGGRMIGAASFGLKYIGIDPLTVPYLENIRKDLNLENITLIKEGSENIRLPENTIDFAFSSPPYYNIEKYSNSIDQAYNKDENYFYNNYWKNTLNNIKFSLKPNKILAINTNNEQMIKIATEIMGNPINEIKLLSPVSHLNKKQFDKPIKYEIVYVFRNDK